MKEEKVSKANGNANGHARNAETELYIPVGPDITVTNTNTKPGLPHPIDIDRVVTDYPASGAILEMQTGLCQHGRNRALASGATKPVAEDQKALEDHARAMAKRTEQKIYRDSYDPSKHAHDKLRQDEHQQQLGQRGEVQQGVAHARANLRDADTNLAKTPKAREKPVLNPWVVAASIAAINISVSPTVHDSVFATLGDDLLAWLLSLTGAGFVAALLTLAIISGRRSIVRWLGLAAGIAVGIALAMIRLSTADNVGECMFAVGLSIFEIAAVGLLEWLVPRGSRVIALHPRPVSDRLDGLHRDVPLLARLQQRVEVVSVVGVLHRDEVVGKQDAVEVKPLEASPMRGRDLRTVARHTDPLDEAFLAGEQRGV